jgi:CO/xanthine dehydrogenase FAD-binding subunit
VEEDDMLARPGLPAFDYVRPPTREDVVRLLREHGPEARLMMGGTDLLVRMRDGVISPRVVVDVKGVPGMRDVVYDPHAGLTIGAAVTMNQAARQRHVRGQYPLLAEAAKSVAYYQVRNRATVGGNLSNASPAADTAPAVLVLEGRIVLFGPDGEREVPAEQFFLAPGKSARKPEEFVVAVRLPVPPPGNQGRYLKLGRNKAGDLAIVGAAVFAFPNESVASRYTFRIALASVAPVPLRAHMAERTLEDQKPGKRTFAAAAKGAMEAATPIDDVRSSGAYRKEMVRNLTLRALEEVWGELEMRNEK